MPLPTTPKPMDRASGLIRLLNLHYGTSTLENPAEWPQCLLQIQSVLNNLKTLTGRTPNEIVYGFTPNFMINYTTDPDIDLPAAQIDAADALDLPAIHAQGDLLDRAADVVAALRSAGVRQYGRRHVDVLCGHPDARSLFRFLFHAGTVIHRPGSPGESARHGAGSAGVSDLRRGNVRGVGSFGRRGRLFLY